MAEKSRHLNFQREPLDITDLVESSVGERGSTTTTHPQQWRGVAAETPPDSTAARDPAVTAINNYVNRTSNLDHVQFQPVLSGSRRFDGLSPVSWLSASP